MSYYDKVRNIVEPYSTYSLKKTINFMGINAKSVKFTNEDLTEWEDEKGRIWSADITNENNWQLLYENLIYDKELEESNVDKAKRLYPAGTVFKDFDGKTKTVLKDRYWHDVGHLSLAIIAETEENGNGTVIYKNGIWAEIVEEKFKPVMNLCIENWFTHLKIGDVIDADLLNAWTKEGHNYFIDGIWKDQIASFIGNRVIEKIDIRQGRRAFQLEGTSSYLWINAEGFEEFYDNYTKPKLKKPYWKEVKCIKSASYHYTLGKIYAVNDEGYIKGNDGDFHISLNNTTTFSGLINNDASDFEEYVGPYKKKVSESELKEDDWVIGWHVKCDDWRNKPWQVGEVCMHGNNKAVSPKYHGNGREYGTYFKNLKKLSTDEVLEWVNTEYLIGSKYTDSNPRSIGLNKAIHKARYISFDAIEVGCGYVYYEGIWAEKLAPEPSFDEPNMPYTTADAAMVIDHSGETVTKFKVNSKWTYGLNLKEEENPFLLKKKGSKLLKENIQTTRAVDVIIK